MNHFLRIPLLIILIGSTACDAPASENKPTKSALTYQIHYTITPHPTRQSVSVSMQLEQTAGQLRQINFKLQPNDALNIEADGDLTVTADAVQWRPPSDGGVLRWTVNVSHRRGSKGYDAWVNENWGIFRAEDIIPRARTRTLVGASSVTTMSFDLPTQWSAVSEYAGADNRSEVNNPERRFDQPRGWIAMGRLGIRRETIAGTRIAVVAPEGQGARRMDILALLNWTLPEINSLLPEALPRLTIVSAGDPMWRGGLSAPESLYIHSSRPLISENATSTIVHETMHVALGIRAVDGFDWVVEGLAEFYSLSLLHRGGAITSRRYERAIEQQADWAKSADTLCALHSKAATTALAVVTFRNLDQELRKKSSGQANLDHVVAKIKSHQGPISLETLRDTVTELLKAPAETLRIANLPGCAQFVGGEET